VLCDEFSQGASADPDAFQWAGKRASRLAGFPKTLKAFEEVDVAVIFPLAQIVEVRIKAEPVLRAFHP
jgi:hypothetical protein